MAKRRKLLIFSHWRREHLSNMPDSLLFKCDYCHSSFFHLFYVYHHWMSQHSNLTPAKKSPVFGFCDDCGIQQTNKLHRCFRKVLQTKTKPPVKVISESYNCDRCFYETMDKSSLGRHWQLKHLTIRPVPKRFRPPVRCDDCKRPFARKGVLLGHNKTAHARIN